MEASERIQVTDWEDSRQGAKTVRRRSDAPSLWVALAGTVLLHVAIIRGIGLTFSSGIPASVHKQVASKALVVTFLKSARTTDELVAEGIPSFKISVGSAPLLLIRPHLLVDRLAISDLDSGSENSEDLGLSRYEEIYKKQITARVERVWQKPTVDTASRQFMCQVQIEQDEAGNVRETLLTQCQADEAWRESLVEAIRAASPLPAPPDQRVYSSSLVLRFDAHSL